MCLQIPMLLYNLDHMARLTKFVQILIPILRFLTLKLVTIWIKNLVLLHHTLHVLENKIHKFWKNKVHAAYDYFILVKGKGNMLFSCAPNMTYLNL